eukprot:m51a1_g5841 hypothetical protein (407) ;mRNA; r:310420-311712
MCSAVEALERVCAAATRMAAQDGRSRTSIAEQELVIVDGESALEAMSSMLGRPSYCKRAHVVVCCVRDAPARTVELLERQRGAFASLGVVCARHKVSGAADVNVACIAGAVAARLPLLPLWLVSRDQFVVELCDVLRQLRAAASPSPASSQDEHVRSRGSVVACDVGEFIAAHSHCVGAGVPEDSNTDEDEGDGQEEKWAPLEAVDRSPATEDELRRTFREEWHGTQAAFCEEFAINRGHLSSWLGGKASSPASVMAVSRWASQGLRQQPQSRAAAASQEEQWAPQAPQTVETAEDRPVPTEDELRRTFKEEWRGTQAAFCEEFAINKGNFSSWLGGKRSSPASAMAVSRWASQGHRQQPQRQPAPSTPLSASASRRQQQQEQTQQHSPAGYGARARPLSSGGQGC